MKQELARLNQLESQMERRIQQFPEGTFYATRNGKTYKWFTYINGTKTLLRKSERKKAVLLAQKTFLQYQLKVLKKERKAIEKYLILCDYSDEEAYLENHPEVKNLLVEGGFQFAGGENIHVSAWENAPYETSTVPFGKYVYKTLKGETVRSKTEKDIADALFINGIPYRYECRLEFNNGQVIYYPDFTILHPLNGHIYIWEHFGMAELNHYIHKNADKMYTYFLNGYLPGKNLICTYATDRDYLTQAEIQSIIDQYFKK